MMRVYLSHKIRGEKGLKATATEMKENCDEAIKIANELREALPGIEFYVPGEHEDFVQAAFYGGYLTEKEILEIDCRIIDKCDAVMIYVPKGDEVQGGRGVELDYAYNNNIRVCIVENVYEAIEWLAEMQIRG